MAWLALLLLGVCFAGLFWMERRINSIVRKLHGTDLYSKVPVGFFAFGKRLWFLKKYRALFQDDIRKDVTQILLIYRALIFLFILMVAIHYSLVLMG
jgi:hypothetical protein